MRTLPKTELDRVRQDRYPPPWCPLCGGHARPTSGLSPQLNAWERVSECENCGWRLTLLVERQPGEDSPKAVVKALRLEATK